MTRISLFVVGLTLGVGAVVVSGRASADATMASQSRTVPAFHAIDLAGTLEVEVTLGKPASVEVTGEADLLDQVTTTVKDGVLVVNTTPELNRKHHRNHSHLRAIISAPDLSDLAISGTGQMKATGIANERLAIRLPGTGQLSATGSTGSLHVTIDGTGEISAKDLSAKDVVVRIDGTGDAKLYASRSVEARVSGTGAIRVHGHPGQVKKSVSGTGSIRID